MQTVNAIGRRKAAIARVIVKSGSGKITINKREFENYFPSTILQYVVRQPLNKLEATDKFDIQVNLCGGGYKGQAEALRLAIARARDARIVERKKPGRPKARKRFQFSKR